MANRLFSAELAVMNPLLLPADMGIPPDKLFLLKAEMAHSEKEMAPEDMDLLTERLMVVKKV